MPELRKRLSVCFASRVVFAQRNDYEQRGNSQNGGRLKMSDQEQMYDGVKGEETKKEYFPPQPDEDKQGYVYRKLSQILQDLAEIKYGQSVMLDLLGKLDRKVQLTDIFVKIKPDERGS